MTKTCMWFELKTRCLENSGVFILLKACPTGFFHGKTASPKFQFSSPGRWTWGIFNPCMCYLYVYICLWMYWIMQHCDYDVHVLNYALSNKWFDLIWFDLIWLINKVYDNVPHLFYWRSVHLVIKALVMFLYFNLCLSIFFQRKYH